MSDTSKATVRRHARYRIVAPVHFRTSDGEWHEGTTVNIGSRGLLVRTRCPAPPRSSEVDLRIDLSTGGSGPRAQVACTGHLVRAHPLVATGEVVIAVTIERYRLEPAAGTASVAEDDLVEVDEAG